MVKRANRLSINTNILSVKSLDVIRRVLESEFARTVDKKQKLELQFLITQLTVEISERSK